MVKGLTEGIIKEPLRITLMQGVAPMEGDRTMGILQIQEVLVAVRKILKCFYDFCFDINFCLLSLSLLSFLLLFFVIIGQQQMTGYPPPPHPPPHHPPPPPQEGTPAGFSQPRTSYASTADNFTGRSVYPSIPQYIWYASVMSVFASSCVRSSVYVSDL